LRSCIWNYFFPSFLMSAPFNKWINRSNKNKLIFCYTGHLYFPVLFAGIFSALRSPTPSPKKLYIQCMHDNMVCCVVLWEPLFLASLYDQKISPSWLVAQTSRRVIPTLLFLFFVFSLSFLFLSFSFFSLVMNAFCIGGVGACFSTLEMNLNRFSLLSSYRFDIFDGENKFYITLRLYSIFRWNSSIDKFIFPIKIVFIYNTIQQVLY